MPYIRDEQRPQLEPYIATLVAELQKFDDEEIEGVMNYTITEILNRRIRPVRYKWINRIIGVLEAVKLEFYRRIASPYEDKAIEKNGDIPIYTELTQ